MWRLTLTLNAVLMVLFWGASHAVIAPAHNRFVMYADSGAVTSLPVPTALAISALPYLIVVPVVWAVASLLLGRWVRDDPPDVRSERLLAFTLATPVLGGGMLLAYGVAGVLPLLWIGASVS